MSISLAAILAFAYILAYTSDGAYAMPAEKDAAGAVKDVKEPKDIKEAATASKDVKDAVKAAKEAKKTKKECIRDCGKNYEPVCAHDPSNATVIPRTFGTQCAMEVANCEMGSKFAVKSKGECPGAGGVRLS
ncbi:U-Kazal-Dg21.2 [Prorops nasuta]|uniref:U-Kazal-Dg21.2 n=1 Tax=Prorops nasuta TaxID=863751 RepID=UPI0034CEFFE7